MSALAIDWLAVTAAPPPVSEPNAGSVTILTLASASSASTSEKLKSAARKL